MQVCPPRVLGPELLSQLWQSCDVTADSKKLSDSLDEVIPRHKSCIELMLVHVITDIITAFYSSRNKGLQTFFIIFFLKTKKLCTRSMHIVFIA